MSLSGYTKLDALPLNPPPRYTEIRHTNSYCYHSKENKGYRKIYHCVPFTDFETEHLQLFEKELIESGVVLPRE